MIDGKSLVNKLPGQRCTIIREELLVFFEWDLCSALVAHILERKTEAELSSMKHRKIEEGLLWIYIGEEELYLEILRTYTTKPIRIALQKMQAKGVVLVAKQGLAKTKCLLYNYELVDQCVHSKVPMSALPDVPECKQIVDRDASLVGKITDARREFSGNFPEKLPTTEGALNNKVFFKDKVKETTIPYSPLPQETGEDGSELKSPEAPEVPCPDLDIQPDVYTLDFIKNAYRIHNRRAKLDNLSSRTNRQLGEKACQVEAEIGMREFRLKLIGYLSDQSDFLAEKHWPLRVFLGQATNGASMAWLESTRHQALTDSKALSPEAHHAVVDSHPVAPIDSRASWSEIIDIWNRRVPSRPVDWDEKHDPTARIKALASDPKFVECWPGACDKAQRIVEAQGEEGTWLHFRWMIGKNKVNGVANWWRVESGELNSMMTARRKRDKTPDDVIAEAKANIRKQIEEEQHARDARERQLGV